MDADVELHIDSVDGAEATECVEVTDKVRELLEKECKQRGWGPIRAYYILKVLTQYFEEEYEMYGEVREKPKGGKKHGSNTDGGSNATN